MIKKFLVFGTMLIPIIGVIWHYRPKHLVSSANYIPEFFNLPSSAVKGMTVLDELHSQGKTTFSFGVKHYWLKFDEPAAVIVAIDNAGGSETDSVWYITKQRGNYIGTFSVSLKDNCGHLRYVEIEE